MSERRQRWNEQVQKTREAFKVDHTLMASVDTDTLLENIQKMCVIAIYGRLMSVCSGVFVIAESIEARFAILAATK